MMTAGVDVGSATAKACIWDAAKRRVLATAQLPTGWSPKESGAAVLEQALSGARLEHSQLSLVVGTGYGRVALPFADARITEISCHARGAHHLAPGARMVIDIGGQDSKAISLDAAGYPQDFVMNDRCAAGTGKFLEVVAATLGADLGEFAELALQSAAPAPISSVCTVFAESEVIGLMAEGRSREDIAAGLCQAVAQRALALAGQLGGAGSIVLTGGVALNRGVVGALRAAAANEIIEIHQPQMAGAIGAAIIAAERADCHDNQGQ